MIFADGGKGRAADFDGSDVEGLVAAVLLLEQNAEWLMQRRYMQ